MPVFPSLRFSTVISQIQLKNYATLILIFCSILPKLNYGFIPHVIYKPFTRIFAGDNIVGHFFKNQWETFAGKNMGTTDEPVTNQENVIRRQWTAFIATLVLFVLMGLISIMVFREIRYSAYIYLIPFAFIQVPTDAQRTSGKCTQRISIPSRFPSIKDLWHTTRHWRCLRADISDCRGPATGVPSRCSALPACAATSQPWEHAPDEREQGIPTRVSTDAQGPLDSG